MRPSGIHSIVVNTFYSSSARLAAIVARAVYVVVIANQLGPELYGLFNYGMSWYLLFVPLGIIGIDEVMVREIGRHGAAAPAVVDNSLSLRLAAGLGAVVACVALGAGLDGAEPVRALLYVFALALFGRTLSAWSNAVFRGSEASQYLLAQELGFRVLEVVIGLLLLWRGHGLVALAGVHAAGWLLQGVVGVAYVRARFFPRLSLRVERRLLRQLVLAGLPFLAWALLLGWLVQGPVVLGRTAFGDGSALGQLALGAQVFVLVGSVVAELGTAAIPVLTRSAERADGKTRRFAEAALRVAWLL
ncbi:MAG: oligosaccharide flippase family protein, partial [Gammaproteobacteria bacterium]|nr:oligosaccharide flippase family protein [Gammaproteobacteria bacterium]